MSIFSVVGVTMMLDIREKRIGRTYDKVELPRLTERQLYLYSLWK